jgi:hypothetical protein
MNASTGSGEVRYKPNWWLYGYYFLLPALPLIWIEFGRSLGWVTTTVSKEELADSSPFLFWWIGAWYLFALFATIRSWLWTRTFPMKFSEQSIEIQERGYSKLLWFTEISKISKKGVIFRGMQISGKDGRCFIPRSSLGIKELIGTIQVVAPNCVQSLPDHFESKRATRAVQLFFQLMPPVIFFTIAVILS